MNFLPDGLIAFDFKLPIYNWFFPFAHDPISEQTRSHMGGNNFNIFRLAGADARFRALYFHVPFCEAICTFCTFAREVCTDDEIFNRYTDAIIKEIQIKSSYPHVSGTPSLLKPRQIRRIGQAIRDRFDLSKLKEWSFEFHVKSVTPDRLAALKEIGVTHARMGVQSFHPRYRQLFHLNATVEEVVERVALLNAHFPFVSCDMLYGMHGQSIEEMVTDLHHAIQLDTPTLDIYPINNVVTQMKLSKEFREQNMPATAAHAKLVMNVILNEYMRKNGYLPHNGHGYVKASPSAIEQRPVVTDTYRFQYHVDRLLPEVRHRLELAIERGLVRDEPTHYRLTELGWHWYGNLLYYLSPDADQEAIIALQFEPALQPA